MTTIAHKISPTFARGTAPETGRETIQLTHGSGHCYPLYYFIPSITDDQRHLVYHRAEDGQVQLHRLDLTTGESVQITHASATHTHWQPWCTDPGPGVLDHRSVLDTRRGTAIYFDGNDVRGVDLSSLEDRSLFRLPDDRVAIGQNCISGDGRQLIYIHHDRPTHDRMMELLRAGEPHRHLSRGTALAAYDLETGDQHELLRINSPIHHVLPYGEDQLVFCHPVAEDAMLLTDLRGGWYTHMRTQEADHGMVCHFVATEKGIMYEVLKRRDEQGEQLPNLGGIYDPATRSRFETPLPPEAGYTHTGRDPAGELWFFESLAPLPGQTRKDPGRLHYLHKLDAVEPDGSTRWSRITGDWKTYGTGQKSHFHPQLVLDRQWIMMVAGDPQTRTNQIFLIDASDLEATRGIRMA